MSGSMSDVLRLAGLWTFVLVLSACRPVAIVPPHGDAADPSSASWRDVLLTDSTRWSVDTGSIVRHHARTVVWIAVVDTEGERAQSAAPPFLRFETRQELACDERLVRGLDIRTPDQSGTPYVTPVRDSSWRPFSSHALPEEVLLAVCAVI
jgi:hypothetical protein